MNWPQNTGKSRLMKMMKPYRLTIVLAFIFVLISSVVFTDSLSAQAKRERVIMVKSNPVGAMVYFQGETNFVGVTPFKLHPNFRGVYDVTIVKDGFEKSKHTYMFKGNESGTLSLKLNPKTRLKAGMRSLIFPGWGQYYSERKKYQQELV